MSDARLASAIHLLVMVSEAREPLSSSQIAESMGTNAARVRMLASDLRRAGIIESRQGARGFRLVRDPAQLSLLEVYRAVHGGDDVEVFDLHRNPSDRCIVGRHIRPALSGLFGGISQVATRELARLTLADCITSLAAEIEASDDAEELAQLGGVEK